MKGINNSTVRKFAAAKKFISIRSQLVDRFSKGEKIFQSEQERVFASSFFPEDEEDNLNVVMLLDLNYIRQSTLELTSSFTPNFLHTFAAKANPIPKVLEEMKNNGLGVECASIGELSLALSVPNIPHNTVIFDSPSKTKTDIKYSIVNKIPLNIDNYQELERVKVIIKQLNDKNGTAIELPEIGVRINTQVGDGALKGFSTASVSSKFGIPLHDNKSFLTSQILENPFINMVHCHVGSQGCNFDLMLKGVREIVNYAKEINKLANYQQIKTIDIGGGLPVNFESEEVIPTYQVYSSLLRESVPELYSGEFHIITEFGRSLIAKAGYALCSVEYTKESGGMNYANIQTGAEMFIRTIYHPDKWPLRVTVLDKNGDCKPLDKNPKVYNISGPCCIGMDIVAHERLLPEIFPGDYILIHDVGGYYHSSFSYYNSRKAPGFFGFEADENSEDSLKFKTLASAQPLHSTVEFFSRQ